MGRSATRVGPQHNHAKHALRCACTVGGRPLLHGAKRARAARHGIRRRWYGLSKPVPLTYHGVDAVEPRPTARGRARPALAHNTTTPSPHCATHAPWEVDRYCTGRIARAPRATGLEGGRRGRSKSVPSTYRGVGAIEPRPTAWGRACPALAHNTTMPSPHCAARVLRGQLVDTPRGGKRAGRAPHDSKFIAMAF